ncbi:hypothetical protein D3C87_1865860 [compost metagenome]
MPQRSLTLNFYKSHIFVDIKQRFGRIDYLKYDNCGNLNRIPLDIIYLQFHTVEITHPQGYGLADTERNDGKESAVDNGTDIFTKKSYHD